MSILVQGIMRLAYVWRFGHDIYFTSTGRSYNPIFFGERGLRGTFSIIWDGTRAWGAMGSGRISTTVVKSHHSLN